MRVRDDDLNDCHYLFFEFIRVQSKKEKETMAGRHSKWMDSFKAPMNPCSLETIPEPIQLADGSSVWPLMLSCYQLEKNGSRRGHMSLYTVPVPDISGTNNPSLPLQFGEPVTVLDATNTSGILDGKWLPMQPKATTSNTATGDDSEVAKAWSFASAHSTGEIRIHSLQVPPPLPNDLPRLESDPLFTIKSIGQSKQPDWDDPSPPLCLSLSWDTLSANTTSTNGDLRQIVSSYSNGRVAIHDVAFSPGGDQVQLFERDSWQAHNIFTSPAEVWSATFAHNGDRNMILSCGDEGALKFWDVRTTNRPMQVLKDQFEAGVTCASPHPRQPHLVACGSYDETIALFDVRYLSQKPLCHSKKLGGGIWRIKWHPVADDRLLVGAMHGGCRVLRIQGWNEIEEGEVSGGATATQTQTQTTASATTGESSPSMSFKVTKKFTEHESMAYGADWLVCPHPTQNGYFEAAASCSFYDNAVYMWDTVF
jgi:WD40 repeat protein